MKLPSLNYLFSNAKNSFLRFPLTLICAIIATVISIWLTEMHDYISNFFPYINLMLCMALGIPLYFCVVTSAERHGFSKKTQWILNTVATAILVLIWFSLPDSDSTHNTRQPYIRYAIYNIIIHLFVSFLPFISSKSLNGYWQFNKILFVRFWASVLYSGVLYLGLVLALGALHLLFDIHIHDELFFELFIFISGIINTWFFVTGIPRDLEKLDEAEEYPKGLKVFSQYILLPLLAIYLIILYVYGGKILALWHWPRGIVSNLIVSISVLGILTFLLLHPYGKLSGNGWIRIASRAYYFALMPLLIILFIAIGMRLGEYGLTVSRYAIIFLGIWLVLLCIYTALGKTNIKFIPASLAFMLLLISFGPWGIFSASERAQVGRLKTILENAGMMKNDSIVNETPLIDKKHQINLYQKLTNEGKLNDSLHNEVQSIFRYLDDFHGFSSVRGWFRQDIDSVLTAINVHEDKYSRQDEQDLYIRALGIKPEHIYRNAEQRYFNYSVKDEALTHISGYDYITEFNHYGYDHNRSVVTTVTLDSIPYSFRFKSVSPGAIEILYGNDTAAMNFSAITKNLTRVFGEKPQSGIPAHVMQAEGETEKFRFKVNFRNIGMEEISDSLFVRSFTGKLLIRRK